MGLPRRYNPEISPNEVAREPPSVMAGKFDWNNPPKKVGYITFPTKDDSYAGLKIPVKPLTTEELEEKARRETPLDSPPQVVHEDFTVPQNLKFGGGISKDTPFDFGPVPREKMEAIEIEMDDLITQLDQAKLQTASVQASRMIQVPRGFKLDIQMTPSQFYEQYAKTKRREKRKRDMGLFNKGHYRQRHGFRPEELLWNGALEKANCLESNLDNDIHTFFDRNNFDDISDQIYDVLTPAFRLASLFLDHHSMMHYWVTCFEGVRTLDPDYGWRIRVRPATDLRRANAAIDRLKELANRKLVHYTFNDKVRMGRQQPVRDLFPQPAPPEGHGAYAVVQTVCNCAFETIAMSGPLLSRSHITIHRDFYIAAEKMRLMKYSNPAQNLRLWFYLAVTLVHELAHAVEFSRSPPEYQGKEVYHLDNNDNEAGCTWESYVFGGRVSPINGRADGAHGIAVWDWPETNVTENHPASGVPDSDIKYSISMGYIEALQQMKTWQQDYDLWDWKAFHVPKDGATALYVNQFTTMDWREEKRVQEEEYQELMQAEDEQRAKKRRETGTGRAVVTQAGGDEVNTTKIRSHEPTNLGVRPAQLGTGNIRSRPLSRREERWRAKVQKKKEKQPVERSEDAAGRA